ncbi:hypothetical protein NQ315_002826 [Exocentrus adspersus]|uniref:Chromo domain-containing protein n=1 Tax=Exocentrus adspersus TaxID=1586481 RepID=A0AAV8VDU8_9CUCU|nr:hypothetical protein NQ315_002826 [Exocentrus adspersus]
MSKIKEDVVNEIHKPARRNFLWRRVQVRGLNDLIQADLVEMIPYARENSGYRYILVVINVFSKYVWAEAKRCMGTKVKRNIKAGLFKKGDYVRINKYREAFHKESKLYIPTTYLLADQNGQDIEGSCYGEEPQKTLHNDVYLIEKVVRRKRNKLLVKWLGLDKRHNSWIDKTDMV